MHDPEVALGLVFHFLWRMALEAEEYFEEHADQAGMHGQVKQMAARSNHARQLRQAVSERNVLERSRRNNQIERLIGERQTQQIPLREGHIALPSGTVVKRPARSRYRSRRKIERHNRHRKTYRTQQSMSEQAGSTTGIENASPARNWQRMSRKILVQRSTVTVDLEGQIIETRNAIVIGARARLSFGCS